MTHQRVPPRTERRNLRIDTRPGAAELAVEKLHPGNARPGDRLEILRDSLGRDIAANEVEPRLGIAATCPCAAGRVSRTSSAVQIRRFAFMAVIASRPYHTTGNSETRSVEQP